MGILQYVQLVKGVPYSHGTKILAQQYGFSKNQVREILESYAEKKNNEGDDKPIEPCYDHGSGKYLSFEEWMDYFLRDWNKLPVS